jgi:DNA-binding beta-propeller fold protein YncE
MSLSKRHCRILTAALGALAAVMAASPAVSRPLYRIAGTLQLPGEGGWDDLTFDSAGHRLFIAHGARVDVVDTDRLARVGEIADTPGVHGIALAPDLGRGYVSAGAAGTIVVFDLKTLARLKDIKSTGENPDAILYDPATRRIFAFNGRGRNATVIDAVSDEVVGTIALDAKPEFARADGAGRVYVNLEDRNTLAVIDSRTLSVLSKWPITGCEEPSGLALNASGKQLYVACANYVMAVLDATSGQVLGTAPIGGGADGAGYDPGARLAFASCGDGVLMVIAQQSSGAPKVAQSLPTQPGARTMTLDERTHRIFLVTSDFGEAPAPTAEHPHPRRSIIAGTFRLLVVGRFAEKITTGAEGRSP